MDAAASRSRCSAAGKQIADGEVYGRDKNDQCTSCIYFMCKQWSERIELTMILS